VKKSGKTFIASLDGVMHKGLKKEIVFQETLASLFAEGSRVVSESPGKRSISTAVRIETNLGYDSVIDRWNRADSLSQ
jgi:hypothetical protein